VPLNDRPPARIFLSACEASADLHGGHLIRALSARLPETVFTGIGGERMQAAGQDRIFDARDLSVMGLTEVLGRLGAVRRAFASAQAAFRGGDIDVAVLIDSPDFNLRLAVHARRAGIPVVYFISPKFWAWRKGRLKTIAERVDHMMVILPFEKPYFDKVGLPATYVGNPLVDEMAEVMAAAPAGNGWKASDFGLDDNRPVVALVPGSRRKEVDVILPDLLAAAKLLAAEKPEVQFVLPIAESLDESPIRAQAAAAGVPITCVDGNAVALLSVADAAAMASGTVTLQAALADVPGVVVYRAAPLTWAIGRRLVKLENVSLVNLVAGYGVMPELLQHDFTPQAVCDELIALLADGEIRQKQMKGIHTVRERMGKVGAPERAAQVVLAQLEGKA